MKVTIIGGSGFIGTRIVDHFTQFKGYDFRIVDIRDSHFFNDITTIGDHAFTAAGSTIGHDVPAGALGIERAKQAEIDGWGERKLEKYIAKKQKLEAEKKGK